MAHFIGFIQGCRGEASRLGSISSGIHATINGWNLGVKVTMHYDKESGKDVAIVTLTAGSNGMLDSKCIGRFTRDDLEKKGE